MKTKQIEKLKEIFDPAHAETYSNPLGEVRTLINEDRRKINEIAEVLNSLTASKGELPNPGVPFRGEGGRFYQVVEIKEASFSKEAQGEEKVDWATEHKELVVDLKMFEYAGSYVDFIHLEKQKISVRLILKPLEAQKEGTSSDDYEFHHTVSWCKGHKGSGGQLQPCLPDQPSPGLRNPVDTAPKEAKTQCKHKERGMKCYSWCANAPKNAPEEWETAFRREFLRVPESHIFELRYDKDLFDIFDFIRSHFLSRKELREKIEKLRVRGLNYGFGEFAVYAEAIDDALALIDEDIK